MTDLIKFILLFFAVFYLTWFFYIAVMNLKQARDAGRLSRVAKLMGSPILWAGSLINVTLNLSASFILLDLPQEWFFSNRMKRYKAQAGLGVRKRIALFICDKLLNPFDLTGTHC